MLAVVAGRMQTGKKGEDQLALVRAGQQADVGTGAVCHSTPQIIKDRAEHLVKSLLAETLGVISCEALLYGIKESKLS